MYEIFDRFLRIDTWHTHHPSDRERFFQALARIVNNPKFSPDELGRYMRGKVNSAFEPYIRDYISAAWAVREYLEAIRKERGNVDLAELVTKPP
jgi:hypothetical protein